jgi:hypothetical protein
MPAKRVRVGSPKPGTVTGALVRSARLGSVRLGSVRSALLGPALLGSVLVAGCTTGSTLRSGVGDAFFDRAPYYAGHRVFERGVVVHLPIHFHTPDASFGPAELAGSGLTSLLAEMNAYLDDLGASRALAPGTQPGASERRGPPGDTGAGAAAVIAGTPPDVQFGCERIPGDDCQDADDRRPMRLAVARPSRNWVESVRTEAVRADADRVLVISLEVGNYLPRQRNWRGDKEVQLGTGYSVAVPWLTALDRPASVLQVTGALMDLEGRAVRIGAEGLVARRTNIILGGFGIQALISDEDVERARTTRRDDLPGQPLVWQAALSNLVAELTGRPDLASR